MHLGYANTPNPAVSRRNCGIRGLFGGVKCASAGPLALQVTALGELGQVHAGGAVTDAKQLFGAVVGDSAVGLGLGQDSGEAALGALPQSDVRGRQARVTLRIIIGKQVWTGGYPPATDQHTRPNTQ